MLYAEECVIDLKCFLIILGSFKISIESINYLRFALINLLVLFLKRLYSGQLFKCLNVSLGSRALPISDLYQSGFQTDFTRRCLIGACLSNCVNVMEFQTAKLLFAVLRCNSEFSRSEARSDKNDNSSTVLKPI